MNTLEFDQAKYIYRDTPRPVFTGSTGETHPNTIVRIVIGEKQFTAEFNASDGKFSWTPSEDLTDGVYNFAIIVIDAAGNVGKPTLRTLVVDTTPPEAPELINLKDDVGSETGSFDPGELTDDKRPTLTGVAQPNTIVYLRDAAGNNIGSAKTDAVTGKWVIEPNDDLRVGSNALTLVAIEEFGKDATGKPVYRQGKSSDTFIINVGSNDFITIDDALDNAGKWKGVLTSGALTDDSTPTLRGQVSESATVVTIYYRKVGENTWSGSTTVTVNGKNWSWTPSSELPSGNYEFQASTLKVSSALFNLEIFTPNTGDSQTIISRVWDDVGTKTGKLISGDFTDDTTPQFSGRAESNSKVVIQYSHKGIDYSTTVEVGHNGNWTWTPATDLAVGDWSFKVKSEDASVWNDSFELHIYPEPSVTTTITEVFDNVGVTGPVSNDGTTDDNTPTLSGRTEANAIVEIYDGKLKLGSVKANSSGNWSFVTTSLNDGSHHFWAIQQGYSVPSNAWKIEIDTSGLGPDNPTITGLFEQVKSGGYQQFVNGSLITSGNVEVQGKGHAGAIINIYDGTNFIGSTVVNTDGKWSFIHSTPYTFGLHTITATEVKSGNTESSPSNTASFTLTGDGLGGDSRYIFTSFENPAYYGTATLSAGKKIPGAIGGNLTILDGFLGMRDNSFTKKEPGNLKTIEDKGTVSFQTDPTTDFYMAVGGISTGYASLTYYSTTGTYLGQSEFDYTGPITAGNARNTSFSAPAGQLIGKVVLSWNDKGGIYIHNVTYGHNSAALSKGSESFSTHTGDYALSGTHTSSGLVVLDGYAKMESGRWNILEHDAFTFTVGRTTDISFKLDSAYSLDISYYDSYGNLLHSESGRGYISYSAPAGKLISKIIINSEFYPNVYIDDVVWGNKIGDVDYGYAGNGVSIVAHSDDSAMLNGLVLHSSIIDIKDGEASFKEINLDDILSNGDVGLFTAENTHQLMIQGDNNDVVQLKDILPKGDNIEAWTQQKGTITVAGVEYSVYSHSGENAQLLVQSDVKVEII